MDYGTITDLGLSFGDGNENPSGVAEHGFFIPLSFFVDGTGLKAPTAGTTAASLVEITGDHVLKAGKAPIPITPLFSKSGINWESVGEELSQIFQTGAEAFIPDNSSKSLGTGQAIKNYRGILLIGKNDGSNHFWQLGSQMIAAKVTKIQGGTGVGPTGEVGSKVTFQSHGAAPVYVYKGAVPAPAV
ncbi:hypothetical protein DBR40_24760 [Pedobacter sp. KBW01]|uniref:hypothetical protein n=1 Tax=Pedobacter sp. KBW01 TaxID=2153364 RepID=UPI000F5B21BD|nr:hypothetical protein [Pedobacter sp. KBW01]RQO65086.1 hypothetical protein DBR40_24760 [Pedobacter sp. KBW01]